MMNRANGIQRAAIEDLTRALQLDPHDWRCWSTRAQSHAVQEEWTEAINDANAALQLDPNDVDSLLVRAETLLRIAENDTTRKRALVDLRRVVKLAPDDFSGWYSLAETATQLKLWDEAANAAVCARLIAPFGAMQRKISRDDVLRFELDARAELAVGTSPADIEGRLLKARGLANRAAPDHLSEARAALDFLRKLAADPALTAENAPYLAAVARTLATFCYNAGFFSDALVVSSILETLKATGPEDLYFAARISARLGSQQRDGRLQVLGADDEERTKLEAQANGKSQEERDKLKNQAFSQALALLTRSAQAGFGDAARASADSEFVPLRSSGLWTQTLKLIKDAAADATLQASLKARQPMPIVYIAWLIADGQAKARGLKVCDVIYAVADTPISTFVQLRKVLPAQTQPYKLTLRRYHLDADGNFVQKKEGGRLVFDAAGLPVWEFEEVVQEMQPGQLGVRIEEGVIPRELVIP
jgi:hypothetical protein